MEMTERHGGASKRKKKGRKFEGRTDDRKKRRHMESGEMARVSRETEAIAPYSGISSTERKKYSKFSDLPLSNRTLDALAGAEYEKLTGVQQLAVPQGLRGGDVLVAAPTGSGKTLCFVVPVAEALWRAKWSTLDGIGAIILTPTRELAVQIFEVVTEVLKMHQITGGLVIGGKDLATEQKLLNRANILVATPGRLLQHMDESVDFGLQNLKILVLDEADRILDLGFERTMNAIIENLPKERQTLLFSATQTKSVKALVRLSMKDPQYVAYNQLTEGRQDAKTETNATEEEMLSATPRKLTQFYSIVNEKSKLNTIWSFITSHLKCKILVFLTSSKEVRFVYEVLRRLRPGMPLMHLFGRMKLQKRTMTYGTFCNNKTGCLFATDVAARGLDFPAVDWVVQMDCPESLATYIHRVGRTARYTASGKSTLFLLPSETKFVEHLEKAEIPIKKVKVKSAKVSDITPKVTSIVASDRNVKYLAQRALVSFVKAVHLCADKDVFDASKINVKDLASSFGLPIAPEVKIGARKNTGVNKAKLREQNEFGYRSNIRKHDLLKEGKKQPEPSDDEDDFLVVKKTHDEVQSAIEEGLQVAEEPSAQGSRKQEKRKKRQKIAEDGATKDKEAEHVKFGESDSDEDEEEEVPRDYVELASESDSDSPERGFAERVREHLDEEEQADREKQRERVREKHRKQRQRSRRENDMLPMGAEADEGEDEGEDEVDDEKSADQDAEESGTESSVESPDEDDEDLAGTSAASVEAQALRILNKRTKF